MERTEYTVCVYAEGWSEEEGWTGERELMLDRTFDTYDEACRFVRNVTPEQAVEWEGPYEGLDILIYQETYKDGVPEPVYNDCPLGESEWIGDKKNGDWL